MAGPTHCTKLKVYRPKTCGVVPKPLDRLKLRPHTCTSGEKEKMGAMDLAICWDYRPADPRDEPKRPAHIDGSNGSSAPAIFTLVKTPRDVLDQNTGRSGGVFSNTLGDEGFFDKDIMRRNINKSAALNSCHCHRSTDNLISQKHTDNYRPQSLTRVTESELKHQRCKSSPNISQLANAGDYSSSADSQKEQKCNNHHRHHRHHTKNKHANIKGTKIRLCEQQYKEFQRNDQRPIQEYKQAFKAGVPRSNSSGTCSSFDSGCNSSISSGTNCSKSVRIPKPRNPYVKKDYIIDTLAPPFACWRGGAGQGGYPEHWRLASVYQHAYKPVEQRKRPLLATVYQ